MRENDADWSCDVTDGKSTTGFYFKLNGRGAALSCGVKKQAKVAHFSSEAEYQDMAAAIQEALCLQQLFEIFRQAKETSNSNWRGQPEELHQSVTEPIMQKRSKHIETKFTYFGTKRKMGLLLFITFLLRK